VGLPADPDEGLISASREEFRRARTRRFGATNPERMDEPFWLDMVSSGVSAYRAAAHFGDPASDRNAPVWCAERFGQSITFLPDGRVLRIGGEHEDYYDADFCIYNDIFVHHPDGRIEIFGYPVDEFPPTDFHTATLIGDFIYLIGSLGYRGARRFGETPVFRLDPRTLRMETLATIGEAPGWLYGHRATLAGPREIRITGGKVATLADGREEHTENRGVFVLDVSSRVWRRDL
jgi:hypothetical protein